MLPRINPLICSLVFAPTLALAQATPFTTDPFTDVSVDWSPDGTELVFRSDQGSDTELYRATLAGGPPGVAVTSSVCVERQPNWSPDGTAIAFTASQELRVIPAAGGAEVMLASPAANPSWSPDGTQIAYSSTQDILIIPSGGGTATQFTTDGSLNNGPSWSPDGTQIAFRSTVSGNSDLWTKPVAGGSATQLTFNTSSDIAPDWSSNGNIVFVSDRSGNSDLWMIPATGGTAVQLTTDPGQDSGPVWSPDGTRIAFNSDRSGNLDIWLLDVATGVPSPLQNTPLQLRSHPNPFRNTTELHFTLTDGTHTSLTLYDTAGRLVRDLGEKWHPAGSHLVTWDGRDDKGAAVPSGVYFYRLDTGRRVETRKVTVLR